jgi:hypothetical protein
VGEVGAAEGLLDSPPPHAGNIARLADATATKKPRSRKPIAA